MRKPRLLRLYRPTVDITGPTDTIERCATGPIRGRILGIPAPWKLVYFLIDGEWPTDDGRGSEEWYASV